VKKSKKMKMMSGKDDENPFGKVASKHPDKVKSGRMKKKGRKFGRGM
jgi:hypothetical protein